MASSALKPHPAAPYLFSFFLSVFMSGIVSAIVTFRHLGISEGTFFIWLPAWLSSFIVAFPTVLIVNPIVRRIVNAIIDLISKDARTTGSNSTHK